MPKRSPPRIPYHLRSRRERKRIYIKVRNLARVSFLETGGHFATRHTLHGRNTWLDVWFLGREPLVVYQLALQTTLHAYKEAVRERVWELSPDPTAEVEVDQVPQLERLRIQRQTMANSGEVKVFENWTLHRNHCYGIGVQAAIDAPHLTVDVINAFIDRFLDNPTPYLSTVAHTFQYDDVRDWGYEVNACKEP